MKQQVVARFQDPLHEVTTGNAEIPLKKAIEQTDNPKVKVKLATAIDSCYAHAVDIKYHKLCWMNHVSNVLRKQKKTSRHQKKQTLQGQK